MPYTNIIPALSPLLLQTLTHANMTGSFQELATQSSPKIKIFKIACYESKSKNQKFSGTPPKGGTTGKTMSSPSQLLLGFVFQYVQTRGVFFQINHFNVCIPVHHFIVRVLHSLAQVR